MCKDLGESKSKRRRRAAIDRALRSVVVTREEAIARLPAAYRLAVSLRTPRSTETSLRAGVTSVLTTRALLFRLSKLYAI